MDRKDELDVQSQASQSGMGKRQENDQNHSQAISEQDTGGHNKKAQNEHPKAPGPVIGMNDERGSVSLFSKSIERYTNHILLKKGQ